MVYVVYAVSVYVVQDVHDGKKDNSHSNETQQA